MSVLNTHDLERFSKTTFCESKNVFRKPKLCLSIITKR